MRAYVTWHVETPTAAVVHPGIVHEHTEYADSWSLVLIQGDTDNECEAQWLVPEKAPKMVPGKVFAVYQGKTWVCTVEVLLKDEDCDECRRLLTGDYHANWDDGPEDWEKVAVMWIHHTFKLHMDDAQRLVNLEKRLMGRGGVEEA